MTRSAYDKKHKRGCGWNDYMYIHIAKGAHKSNVHIKPESHKVTNERRDWRLKKQNKKLGRRFFFLFNVVSVHFTVCTNDKNFLKGKRFSLTDTV